MLLRRRDIDFREGSRSSSSAHRQPRVALHVDSPREPPSPWLPQSGQILALFALVLVMLMGLLAFVVDLGMLSLSKEQLHIAADAGALGGLGALRFVCPCPTCASSSNTRRFSAAHRTGKAHESCCQARGRMVCHAQQSHMFMPARLLDVWNALRITVVRDDTPLFFFGRMSRRVAADAGRRDRFVSAARRRTGA